MVARAALSAMPRVSAKARGFLPALTLVVLLGSAGGPVRAADRYTIDPDHTFSSFEYGHWGLSRQRSRFDRNTGFIELDEEAGKGVVDIDIDAASVSTGSLSFNDVLRSPSFFDAANYPRIRFTSSDLRFLDGSLVEVDGELTIKGITKPVALEIDSFNCRFMLAYGKRACGANGSARILRSDFELGRYVPFVSDEVTLHIAVEAIKDY